MPITRRRRANPPDQPENNNHNAEQPVEAQSAEQAPPPASESLEAMPPTYPPAAPMTNGDRSDRPERVERQDHQQHPQYPSYPPSAPPHITEGGRRTARGEVFRRAPQPPQPPAQQPPAQQMYSSSAGLEPPTHEISLPLGNLLHLAYNPGYTGSDEARSLLLKHMSDETRAGGRARCWNCGSIAIAYDRWNTRSKTFGEIGIAFCEICGVWSVL